MKNQLFSFLVICVIIGIFVSEYFFDGANLRIYFLLLLFCLFISQLIPNINIRQTAIYLQFFCLGIIVHQTQKTVSSIENHSTKDLKINTLIVLEKYKSSDKYLKYKVKNLTFDRYSLLHIPLHKNNIYPHDTLIVYGNIFPLSEAKNPFQFDYSAFLERKNISHSIYADTILYHASHHKHWMKITLKSKEKIRDKLEEAGYRLETRSIISSMLLGDRSEITEELNNSYIATGVVHILSISGLHVVMIFVILQFVLRPIQRIKNGKRLQIILALMIIWVFAFYVEMQPPVFRSALMISIYYISELLKRPKNIYHTISLSAFIILLFQPNFLFDIGFQLSFSAVFFIVWLHPIYKKILQPHHKISTYMYDLSTTSISAQLGTLPFTTLYFNQFSWLFLLGNVFLVPASFLMIIGAILSILFILFHLDIPFYVTFFNWFIESCNAYIKWLATHEFWVLKHIYISPLTAILIFVILLAIRPLILERKKGMMAVILFGLIGIQTNRYMDINRIKNENEVIVFHQYKGTLIGIRNGQKLAVIHSAEFNQTKAKDYIIRPYLIRNRIKDEVYIPIDSIAKTDWFYKSRRVIYTSKFNLFIGENLTQIPSKIDYILVRNSSFKPNNLENLSQIKRVIADGSNYPNYIIELDSILKPKSDSILWKTSEQGFYRIKF